MLLKQDFLTALAAEIAASPTAATAYRAGDPRLLAQLNAMAAMLAMLSQQVDVAEVEPFLKARTGTVLADAALKGVLPLAKPSRVQVAVTNNGTTSVPIAAGRGLVDGKGRTYVVEGSASIPAGGTANLTALQRSSRTQTDTVAVSEPFYQVQVAGSPDGLLLVGIEVSDGIGAYTYTPDYCNVLAGDKVFHVETDEQRRVFLRFGADDANGAVVGYQPPNGTVLTITIYECSGATDLETGASFALSSLASAAEGDLVLTLGAILATGAAPPSIDVLRVLSRYPALHDGNAVFLSNFDFLLRRHLAGVEFLSVWNEQTEESVRGPSVNNVNKLFVSVSIPSQTTAVTQAQVRAIVARADDSLRVVFVTPVEIAIPITITAQVAAVHDTGDVAAQIRSAMLALYGKTSVNAARGLGRTFRLQAAHDALKAAVPALQDVIADFQITPGTAVANLPEQFRYLSNASITVAVTRLQDTVGLWSL